MPITGTPTQRKKKVFDEFKAGTLNSGKGGPIVKNPKQAVAIALSEARKGVTSRLSQVASGAQGRPVQPTRFKKGRLKKGR